MWQSVISGGLLLLVLGCGSDPKGRQEPEVRLPRIQTPRNAPKDPLAQLAGYYDLVELDGEKGLAGYVGILFDDSRAGFTVDPLLTADNPAPRLRWVTARDRTAINFKDGAIHQLFDSGEEKIEIKYEASEKTVSISGARCTPVSCEPFSVMAKKPD